MSESKTPPRHIDPEILQGLGEFVVVWGLLENLVQDLFIATVEGKAGPMMVVTKAISASTISNWIRTTIGFRQTQPDFERAALEFLNDYDELRAERNSLIHGLWVTDASGPGTVLVHTIRLDRRPPVVGRIVTAGDLRELIQETLVVAERLRRLMDTHNIPHRDSLS